MTIQRFQSSKGDVICSRINTRCQVRSNERSGRYTATCRRTKDGFAETLEDPTTWRHPEMVIGFISVHAQGRPAGGRAVVDVSKHDYDLEPNASFTPDGKLLVFRSNMQGALHTCAVVIDK